MSENLKPSCQKDIEWHRIIKPSNLIIFHKSIIHILFSIIFRIQILFRKRYIIFNNDVTTTKRLPSFPQYLLYLVNDHVDKSKKNHVLISILRF
jgi:hypothetical protein